MGSSDSYSGSSDAAAKMLRKDLNDWLDSLPDAPPPEQNPDAPPPEQNEDFQPDAPPNQQEDRPLLPPESLLSVVPLLGLSGSGGTTGHGVETRARSGGGFAGGAQRSARVSSIVAGRAGAAAYALRVGDGSTLQQMGLNLDSLRDNDDPIDVARQVVNAACNSALSDGTIEDEERRYVAAEVTCWVLEENQGQAPPTPEEIIQKAIAVIISEAVLNETVAMIRRGERPEWASLEAERQIRDAAEVLARRVEVSTNGIEQQDFTRAIEEGIEILNRIRRGN